MLQIFSSSRAIILKIPQSNLCHTKKFSIFKSGFRVSCNYQSARVLGASAPIVHNSSSSSSSGGGGRNVDNNANNVTSATTQSDLKKLTYEEWAKRLSPEAYATTREGQTEAPFTGKYVNHKAEGVYKCVCCGSDLFTSKAKFDSGSGWPSFFAPAEEVGVTRRKDVTHGMVRTEILCSKCDAHLGHVFDDGPPPTGQRYCVNSAALKFSPKKIN